MFVVISFVFAAGLTGCGSSDASPDGFHTKAGSSIVFPSLTKVTFVSTGGGFRGVPPQGAPCDPAVWSYTISVTDQSLSSSTCSMLGTTDVPESYVPSAETVTLTASQWATVDAAITAVTVSDRTSCGADADDRHLTVESATGALTYGDDFYACQTTYPYFVTFESLNGLETALRAIP